MTTEEITRLREAFERGDEYIDALSDSLYLTKLRVYSDTLGELADQFGYDSDDVQLGEPVLRALSAEADANAERIAETYNRDLERRIARLGALGLSYEQAVEEVFTWTTERDEARSQLIGITEAYTAHADATMAFFSEIGVEPDFEFGGHAGDAPPACPICELLEATNPHPMSRVLDIGNPHPQCRQNWHPLIESEGLPDEIAVGLQGVAGIVGSDSLITREGSQQGALDRVEDLTSG